MAGGRNEYTGVTPPELQGKKRFVCDVCLKKRSIVMLDWHHVTPQAGGGTDDPANFAKAETGCHIAIHRVALRLNSLKAGKKSAASMARDIAESITPDDVEGTQNRILYYAVQVAAAMAEKRNGKTPVGDSDIVITNIPPKFKKLFLELGKRVKGKSGKSLGMSNVCLLAAMGTLEKHHPEESDNIRLFLSERGLCDFAPKPEAFPVQLRYRE